MNEDDTFNALRRTPIDQVHLLIWQAVFIERKTGESVDEVRNRVLRENGWVSDEYDAAREAFWKGIK